MKEKKPFGIKDKIGYMLGDIGNDFSFIFASTYVMIFYSKVMGVRTETIGVMFLVARLVDAFTDVGMGRIVDLKKAGKNGKFRPWLLRMCGPVAIASFLMYQCSLVNASMTVKIVYMFITYLLWGSIFYTSINIPYGSMASVISNAPKDRSSLSVFRSLGGGLAGVLIMSIAPKFVYFTDANGNQAVSGTKFTLIAGVFSICAILCYLGCYFLVTERVEEEPKNANQRVDVFSALIEVFSSRALAGIIFSAVLMLFASILGQSVNNYVYTDYFNSSNAISVASALALPAMFILAIVSTKLATKYGKKECGVVGMFFSAAMYGITGVLHLTNVWVFVICMFISMLGMYFFMMQCYALVTDVIDDKEVRTGTRDDATIYGIYSFARKVGQAIAGYMAGKLLGFIQYDELAVVQTESVKNGIYNIVTFGPAAIYFACGLVLLLVYPLSKEKVEANVLELKRRRGEQ